MSAPSPPALSPSPSPNDSSDLYAYIGSYDYEKPVGVWEEWDIRVLTLCIIFAQLYLHVLGSRRKWKISRRMNVTIWLLYLSSELISTIALGKLSKLNKCKKSSDVNILRVLWAPTILFYLGGPDTITVSSLGEADTWGRHFIGLSIQGLRISNIMWVAWTEENLSLVALLMLFPGIVKYGEKVWNIWSRTEGHFEGFVRSDDLDQPASSINKARPKSELVLRAYSYFQTLKPHNLKYFCEWEEQKKVVKCFNKWIEDNSAAQNAFKLIEIELGFMHDMLFNRIGTIFTIWGCIVRIMSFSFLVCTLFMLVYYIYVVKVFLDFDLAISFILLLGAIFLDMAGVVVQLFSDWAVIWVSRHRSKLWNPILRHQEHLISKRKRWSGCIGECNLLDATPRTMKCSKNMIQIPSGLKDLIINQLREAWPTDADKVKLDSPLTSAMRRGAPSENQNELKWSIGAEFGESIVTWHIVTDLLSEEHDKDISKQVAATKTLSHYMMYLLIWRPSNLAFCNTSCPVKELCSYVKENSPDKGSNPKLRDLILKAECDFGTLPMRQARTFANNLKEKENRWEIMSNIWVEMLIYAASNCPVRQHAQNVRHGGEFLTHVWLLLLHLGVAKRLELKSSQDMNSVLEKFCEGAVGESCFSQ